MKKTELSVYEFLRNKIINLEFFPGEELDINKITAELGISRSPVRDALLRLELDKLVEIFPQRGTRVSKLDRKIIHQERFMRTTLELGVVALLREKIAFENVRSVFATKLQGIFLQQKASLLDNDKKKFLKFDDDFHFLFYEETGNQWLWDLISSHTGNDHRIRILSYNAQKIADTVEKEHKNLIDAIFRGNIDEALEIDRKHLERVFSEFEPLEKIYPEYFV